MQEERKNMSLRILRLPEIKTKTGFSRSALYSRIQQRLMTKPISLGGRAVGWPESEIDQILAAQIAGKSNEEIFRLVEQMTLARKNTA
jgi:prophage regulatory protein